MKAWSPLVEESLPSFGYFPDPSRIDIAAARVEFTRVLVLDAPVTDLFGIARECRVLWNPEVELPEGLYWFEGLDTGSFLLQVPHGAPPGQAMVEAVESLTEEHPLAAAWGWAEELWPNGTRVPAPRFEINEPAITQPGDVDVVVRDRKFLTSQWSYTVIVDGRQQNIVESRLASRPETDDPASWVRGEPTPASQFGATLTRAKLLGKFANTLYSFRATRTTFRPFQFKPVLKLLQTGKARLLIADEVGLGKTIEAGLIWTELEARREADRVLIVCPSSLLGKWRDEMDSRFGFELTELDVRGLDEFLSRHLENRLPRRHAYVCSLERLRTWAGLSELRELPPVFDLVIVDEAHSMRNQDTKSYALGTELAEWADNLVFLTATPINLRQEDLLNLLELLAPEDYGDIADLAMRLEPNRVINTVAARLSEKDVSGRQLATELETVRNTGFGTALARRPDFSLLQELLAKDRLSHRDIISAKRYLAELNTLSTVITRTKKVEVDDRKAKRTEDRQEIAWTRPEIDFYDEYVQWCVARAEAADSPLYFAMQMPLRLASACLPVARRRVLSPPDAAADEESAAPWVPPHAALVEAALRVPEDVDTKFDALLRVVRELRRVRRRMLLFTHSRPTLTYLAARLRNELRVAVMHGDVHRDDRRRIMAEFRAGAFDIVLANRVASEGLDFEFCSAVINYDLPWNPMEIEQRIGRIDRIGQPEETILIINFVNPSTIDERILTRLLDRIEIFESSIGALEPIIASQAPKALQAGFDFTLTADQREQKVHEVLTAIEEQRAGLKEVADASSALLISNDVDVAGLEADLVRTGRYVGQIELALLLDDWARVDGAGRVRIGVDGRTVEFVGNAAMAARVDALAKSDHRTRLETSVVANQLRDELPISFVLDQELARTGGGALLTATSPLILAAASIPAHRQARFASLRVPAPSELVVPGIYVVAMATAVSASAGGDEIWGAAVNAAGRNAGEEPADALMAALARGELADSPLPQLDRLDVLTSRAVNALHLRHESEQHRRDSEFFALQDARSVTLRGQHERKLATIETRIGTARSRGTSERTIDLFRAQRRRAEERFSRLSAELQAATQPEIRLEPLAVCVVRFVDSSEAAS